MWSDVWLKNSCSNRGWSWQVLCSHKKCCCICSLCRGYYCYWGIFVFCIFSRVFSWFFTDVTTIRILVCVSIKYLINPSFERISLGWNSKYSRGNLLFLTSRCSRVFNVSCKTNRREPTLFAKTDISQVTWLLRASNLASSLAIFEKCSISSLSG